jgi:hypothetical protein
MSHRLSLSHCLTIMLLMLVSYSNAQSSKWKTLGTGNGLVSGGDFGFRPAIALDTADVPYICYGTKADYVAVRRYNGAGWEDVGIPLHFPDSVLRVYYTDVAIDKHNNLYAGFLSYFDSAGHSYSDGKFRVVKWNGTSWTQVGTTTAFDPDTVCPTEVHNISLAIGKNDTVYAAVSGATASSPYQYKPTASAVFKFDGSGWVRMGNPYLKGYFQVQLAIDTAGIPYLAATEDDFSTVGGTGYIYKWHDTGWAVISDSMAGFTSVGYLSIAINKATNTLYAYHNNGTLESYNGATWQLHGTDIIYTNSSYDLQINNAGMPVICFENICTLCPEDRCARIYNGTSWEPVGGPFISPLYGTDFRMAISSNDEIFATYNYFGGTSIPDAFAIYYGSTLGIAQTSQVRNLKIYPNPVIANSFTIAELPTGKYQLALINALGQEVYSTQLNQHAGANANISLPSLPVGVYHLKICDDKTGYSAALAIE